MSRISVVVPVYRNAGTVEELHARLREALGEQLAEVVFVDDASPDESRDRLRSLRQRFDDVVVVEREVNGGQQRALLDGLARADADWVVTMDADLQDPPEEVAGLIAEAGPATGAVFAARRGRYESAGRHLSGRAFRRVFGRLSGLPEGGGGFVALRRDVVEHVLRLPGSDAPYLPGMVAATGTPARAVPVERARSASPSGYSSAGRLRVAGAALRWGLASRRSAAAHNEIQRTYYDGRDATSIEPGATPYNHRQVDRVIDAGALRDADRILDVGCGRGRATLILHERGFDVDGLDLTPSLLATLRERSGGAIPTHEADVAHPPAELHGRYDAVVGFFMLHHLQDLSGAFAGVRRVLKPGGRAVFIEPNAFCPLFYVQVATAPTMSFRGDGGIVRMRPGLLEHSARAAGFTEVRHSTWGMVPPFAANRPRGRELESVLEDLPLLRRMRAFRMLVLR